MKNNKAVALFLFISSNLRANDSFSHVCCLQTQREDISQNITATFPSFPACQHNITDHCLNNACCSNSSFFNSEKLFSREESFSSSYKMTLNPTS